MKKTFYSIIGLITMLPYIVFAQGSLGGITYINPGNNTQQVGTQLTNLVKQFTNIANYVYGAMFVVALILFFIGIMKYMVAGKEGEAGKQKEAYKFLGFGILALTVMVSI
ncbi:MAG: hypothetical protein QM532_00430 [Cyanobium sp. MAG06]|nr:hypothetical protein [Cyanobium sp. MAG06]